jgi:hypothetical protein
MGIHDRDYMRDRRPARSSAGTTSSDNTLRLWMGGLAIGLIVLGVFAIKNDANRNPMGMSAAMEEQYLNPPFVTTIIGDLPIPSGQILVSSPDYSRETINEGKRARNIAEALPGTWHLVKSSTDAGGADPDESEDVESSSGIDEIILTHESIKEPSALTWETLGPIQRSKLGFVITDWNDFGNEASVASYKFVFSEHKYTNQWVAACADQLSAQPDGALALNHYVFNGPPNPTVAVAKNKVGKIVGVAVQFGLKAKYKEQREALLQMMHEQ